MGIFYEKVVDRIDKVSPNAPVAAADITAPTNRDVTVTAVFSEDSARREYSRDGENWSTYTSGVLMTANGTVYFRGTDEAGNVSETTSYVVSNIDKAAPDAPTAAADIIALTNLNVTVTAAFSEDSVQREYSLDGTAWSAYTEPVVLTANGTV